MSDARLTITVASSPAPTRSPSVAFTVGSATGKISWRPPARIVGVDQLLAYTGLRFCHASALHWADWEEAGGVLRVSRKQVRGKVGSVTRKKRAPKEYTVEPELAEIL
jgi:hypothetical protein